MVIFHVVFFIPIFFGIPVYSEFQYLLDVHNSNIFRISSSLDAYRYINMNNHINITRMLIYRWTLAFGGVMRSGNANLLNGKKHQNKGQHMGRVGLDPVPGAWALPMSTAWQRECTVQEAAQTAARPSDHASSILGA